jgi:hypothetical protein
MCGTFDDDIIIVRVGDLESGIDDAIAGQAAPVSNRRNREVGCSQQSRRQCSY